MAWTWCTAGSAARAKKARTETGSLKSRDSSRYGLMASSTALTSGCAATCRIALPRSPVTSTTRTTRLPRMNSVVRQSFVVASTSARGGL
jgi:hypothetical protein